MRLQGHRLNPNGYNGEVGRGDLSVQLSCVDARCEQTERSGGVRSSVTHHKVEWVVWSGRVLCMVLAFVLEQSLTRAR